MVVDVWAPLEVGNVAHGGQDRRADEQRALTILWAIVALMGRVSGMRSGTPSVLKLIKPEAVLSTLNCLLLAQPSSGSSATFPFPAPAR